MQAWTFLRAAGFTTVPTGQKLEDTELGRAVYGMGVEVGMPGGLDSMAMYVDGTVRYYNYTGAAMIIDSYMPDVFALTSATINAGQRLVQSISPYPEPGHLAAPGNGIAAIYLYTPGGLRFAGGPALALQQDPNTSPVMLAAVQVLNKLTALNRK